MCCGNEVLELARIEQGDVSLQRAPEHQTGAVRACLARIQTADAQRWTEPIDVPKVFAGIQAMLRWR